MLVRLGRECLRGALIAALVASTGCFGDTPGDGDGDGDGAGECEFDSDVEKEPGYPFDLNVFNTEVIPLLASDCALCHDQSGNMPPALALFEVFKTAAQGNCEYIKTFNNFQAKVDLLTPANSRIIFAMTASPTHPLKYAAGDPKLATLNGFITNANLKCVADGGCVVGDVSYFDQAVYETQIQPIINTADGKGCANVGCHLGTDDGTGVAIGGQNGFSLFPQAAPGTPQIAANFKVVTTRMDLTDIEQSLFYFQATNRHGAGQSALVSGQEAAIILDWIAAAKVVFDDNNGEQISCSDATKLNADVFRDEILPLLKGDVDYNDINGDGNATGCTRGPCHGQDRGPATFSILDTDPIDKQLENFACFIDLLSPSNSQVLLCPTNSPGCRKYPHPGDEVLEGADDLNYQRLLSFMFASTTDSSPLDFAFYARRINTIFDDENAVASIDNTTCADTQGCHGVTVAGQRPPNGSNFPIIPNVTDENRLKINFAAASNFINFIDPGQSSLFLYPSNEIANVDNPFATGIPHGGGEAFAVDSQFALDVLTWAQGLRPDGQGFLLNWLIAGDFSTNDPDDEPLSNQDTIQPKIFDDGGTVLGGIFDGFFSLNQDIDVGTFLDDSGGNVGNGRIAYAVAYLINSSGRDFQNARLTISTDNEVEVQAGEDGFGLSPVGGGDAVAVFDIPSYSRDQTVIRILIKIFEDPADDVGMVFSAKLEDENDNAITDVGDIIVRLDAAGGI